MIVFKTLKWGNIFSYGNNNELKLSANPITQVLGLNGHGKSSIPLILEEVLFNKNSKGIKRGDILNRYTSEKKYFISVEFEKISENGVENYLIETSRGTTQSVKFVKIVDGSYDDLSSHTSTATYKNIENVLGFSHETFVSLIYQSSAQSMQFLTATDTVRKKFLVELLGLSRYTEAFDKFKLVAKEVADQVLEAETKISTIQKWLDKNSGIDLILQELKEVPEDPSALKSEVITLQNELENIDSINKKIVQNNQYKTTLSKLVVEDVVPPGSTELLVRDKAEAEATKKYAEAEVKQAKALKDTCPTCKQSVDISFVPALIVEKEAIILEAAVKIKQIQTVLDEMALETAKYKAAEKVKQDYEKYSALYDKTLSSTILDSADLENRISTLNASIKSIQQSIKDVLDFNTKATAKNAQIELIKEQSLSMNSDLESTKTSLAAIADRLANLEILKKAFSTNGLLAYKIECLVKDLEDITNSYLSELSSGRFQLSFKISGEKLNVIITDNGVDIDISALSSGERSRVNTATLLAIRRLMQALSTTKVNLLVLDETIDSLDSDGKEKLVEVLLNEPELNTFLISHGYTHPLLEKITVIKENNVSRIE